MTFRLRLGESIMVSLKLELEIGREEGDGGEDKACLIVVEGGSASEVWCGNADWYRGHSL